MAHILADRVLESTTTTGTGALALAGSVTSFRRFSAVCAVADTVSYFIEAVDSLGQPTGDYEYGTGTYSAANQLTRTTVLGSSNAGAAVNFPAGSKNVGIALLASTFTTLQASRYRGLVGKTFPYSITVADSGYAIGLNNTGALALPLAGTVPSGGGFHFKALANGVVVSPSGGNNLYLTSAATPSITLNDGDTLLVVSDALNWYVFN